MPKPANGGPRQSRPRPCTQPTCSDPVEARDLCNSHYRKFRLYGDPNGIAPRFRRDPAVRFWGHVEVGHPAGCWWWRSETANGGYGLFRTGSSAAKTVQRKLAHRWSYEHLIGPIPQGLQLDHLCRNPLCVNPDHLEPVTPALNQRRGPAANKTHCVRGHRYDEANTYRNPANSGRRVCRTCHRLDERQRRRQIRAQGTSGLATS